MSADKRKVSVRKLILRRWDTYTYIRDTKNNLYGFSCSVNPHSCCGRSWDKFSKCWCSLLLSHPPASTEGSTAAVVTAVAVGVIESHSYSVTTANGSKLLPVLLVLPLPLVNGDADGWVVFWNNRGRPDGCKVPSNPTTSFLSPTPKPTPSSRPHI